MDAIDLKAAQIAATQHGTFRSEQVPGLSIFHVRVRVRSGRWLRIAPSTFLIAGSPTTWEQQMWTTLHRSGAGAVVGLRSAARVHEIPNFDGDHLEAIQPEQTTPRGAVHTSRRSSSLPAHHTSERQGFPVTSLERTLFDLAGLTSLQRLRRGWVWIPERRVERALDDMLVRNRTTIAKVRAVFSDLAGHGRPGTQLMRGLIEERSDGYVPTESDLEDLFVRFVTEHHLPVARRQVELGSASAYIGRVDFLYDDVRLIVEVDGSRFHDIREVARADKRRDLRLLAEGWDSIRIDWTQLSEESSATAVLLRRALARRRQLLGIDDGAG